jgi:hypothetical protein
MEYMKNILPLSFTGEDKRDTQKNAKVNKKY